MTDDDAVVGGVNDFLTAENERLEREVQDLRAMLNRPVTVQVQASPGGSAKPAGPAGMGGSSELTQKLANIQTQISNLATNTSYVASAIQASNSEALTTRRTLERIAVALEKLAPEDAG